MNLKKRIQKSLGPGILLAGAAIGGSHLLSSTTAGARFGFSLSWIGLIFLTLFSLLFIANSFFGIGIY